MADKRLSPNTDSSVNLNPTFLSLILLKYFIRQIFSIPKLVENVYIQQWKIWSSGYLMFDMHRFFFLMFTRTLYFYFQFEYKPGCFQSIFTQFPFDGEQIAEFQMGGIWAMVPLCAFYQKKRVRQTRDFIYSLINIQRTFPMPQMKCQAEDSAGNWVTTSLTSRGIVFKLVS